MVMPAHNRAADADADRTLILVLRLRPMYRMMHSTRSPSQSAQHSRSRYTDRVRPSCSTTVLR